MNVNYRQHKARLKPPEFMTRVHLGNRQDNSCPMTNAMESDLLGPCRDILKTTHHQIAPGIQGPGGIVHRQLKGLQLLRQSCNKEEKNHQEKT